MSLESAPLSVGTLLHDRYEVRAHLGAGKYGDVYEVLDHNLNQQVALKLMKPIPGEAQDWAEAQLLRNLESEFTLPVLNAAVIPALDLRYVTTPLAQRGDLARAAESSGRRIKEVLRWCQQAATGVARIHDAGLLHRDIKAENIFISSNGIALVGDLGLAALMDDAGTADPQGTQYTAAPELFRGGRCSVHSDTYSLGVTTFVALSGVWPRGAGGSAAEVAQAALSGDGPSLRDLVPYVPQSVARVVDRAMHLDPEARYGSVAELASELGRTASGIGRDWTQNRTHSEHLVCYQASRLHGRSAVDVCVVPGGSAYEVRVVTQPGGVRKRTFEPASGIVRRDLPKALRRVVQSLG
jgi:eukaryotic-like serine/threonine-protein kinase